MIKVEIIASTYDDAMKIQECGGNRIELIMGFEEDGLTPSYALIEKVTQNVDIPVNVMVRPHAKTFEVNKWDIEVMKREIEIITETKANGIVIGGVTPDGKVDMVAMKELLSYRKHLDVTFHACFNGLSNFDDGLADIEELGVTNVLTKGGDTHILENLDILKGLVEKSKKVNILVGANINHDNVIQVCNTVKPTFIHVGTAVRENNSRILGVDCEKLKSFLEIIHRI